MKIVSAIGAFGVLTWLSFFFFEWPIFNRVNFGQGGSASALCFHVKICGRLFKVRAGPDGSIDVREDLAEGRNRESGPFDEPLEFLGQLMHFVGCL